MNDSPLPEPSLDCPLTLASLAAGTEIDRAFFNEIMGSLPKDDPLREYVPSPQVEGYADIIKRHMEALMAKVEGENAEAKRVIGGVRHENERLRGVERALRADLTAARAENASNTGEWATLMSDVHDYFADEKADRSAGRVRLVLTLLGRLRIERDQLRADLADKEADAIELAQLKINLGKARIGIRQLQSNAASDELACESLSAVLDILDVVESSALAARASGKETAP